jgi:arsenite-transporting ATPase
MIKNEFDVYVFDTAPTANARRLLGMSKVYSLWVNKMMKSRDEARSLRELLSFTKKKEADPLMDYLVSFRDRMGQAQKMLTNPDLTAFFFVTLAEALPIAVITRFIGWFHEFGIPVGGVVVNMLIDKSQVNDSSPDFVRNRVGMQDRSIVPLYETEVRGVSTLSRTADDLFA